MDASTDTHRAALRWRDITLLPAAPFRTLEVLTANGSKLTVLLFRHGSAPITVAGPALSDIDVLLLALDVRRSDRGVGCLHKDDSIVTDDLRAALVAMHQHVEVAA